MEEKSLDPILQPATCITGSTDDVISAQQVIM